MQLQTVVVDEDSEAAATSTAASRSDMTSWEVVAPIDVQEIDRSLDAIPVNTHSNMDGQEVQNDDPDERSVMLGAAAAGGCLGCLMGGPCLAFICGAASAYGATQTPSTVGDCARCMGHVALSCHAKTIEINDKYQIADKTKTAGRVCWENTRDVNERHRRLERTKECLVSTWEAVKESNRNHRFTDRAFEAIGYACSSVTERVIASGSTQVTAEAQPAGTFSTHNSEYEGTENNESDPQRGTRKAGPYVSVPWDDS